LVTFTDLLCDKSRVHITKFKMLVRINFFIITY
jgi:hypothetical protein